MKMARGILITIMTLSSTAFAQRSLTPVSTGAERASQILNGFRLVVDQPAAVPAAPEPEAVPGNGDFNMIALTYQSEPGLSLYRQMQAMSSLSVQACNGNPCRGLWGIEEGYFSAFASMYKSTIPFLYTADKELGEMANTLADRICKSKYTVDEESQEALYRMLYTQNEVLVYLKVIQMNAGRKSSDVAFCVASELPVE